MTITETTDRDPFAFARQDDDAEILSLFRRWIDEVRFLANLRDDQAVQEASCDRQLDLEAEIDDVSAQGPAGLAIKAYLYIYWTAGPAADGDPASVSPGNDDDGMYHALAVLRDAARFVPEIAQLIGEARA